MIPAGDNYPGLAIEDHGANLLTQARDCRDLGDVLALAIYTETHPPMLLGGVPFPVIQN